MTNLKHILTSMAQLPERSKVASVSKCKPSTIQRLPWNVVERIIQFILTSYSNPLEHGAQVDDHTYLRPLFGTCRNLRSGALQMACRECKFVYDHQIKDVYMDSTDWLFHMMLPKTIKCEFVLDVVLCIDSWSIYSGTVMDAFQKSQWKDFVFPDAYNLKINFRDYKHNMKFKADYHENIKMFAKFIHTIAPNIATVELDNVKKIMPYDKKTCILGNALLQCMYGNTPNKVLACSFGNPAKSAELASLSGLTAITFTQCANLDAMAAFVRKNHESLKVLNLQCTFQNDQGISSSFLSRRNIIYYNLVKLSINTFLKGEHTFYPGLFEQTIFPCLKYLQANFYGDFPDQELFCCHKTLERLEISLDDVHASMINKSNIFGNNNFQKLKQVQIVGRNPNSNSTLFSNAMLKLAFDAGVSTTVVNIKNCLFHNSQLDNYFEPVELKSIKKLDLDRAELDFSNIIAILKALPSLHYLMCESISIGDEYVTTHVAKLVDDMTAAYYPLNMNLATITAKGKRYANCVKTAKCAMLIAVLCPHFANVLINSRHVADYNDEVHLQVKEYALDCTIKRYSSLFISKLY